MMNESTKRAVLATVAIVAFIACVTAIAANTVPGMVAAKPPAIVYRVNIEVQGKLQTLTIPNEIGFELHQSGRCVTFEPSGGVICNVISVERWTPEQAAAAQAAAAAAVGPKK